VKVLKEWGGRRVAVRRHFFEIHQIRAVSGRRFWGEKKLLTVL